MPRLELATVFMTFGSVGSVASARICHGQVQLPVTENPVRALMLLNYIISTDEMVNELLTDVASKKLKKN